MGRSEKCGAQGGAPRTWRIWRCPWRMRAAGAGARPGAARMRGTAAVGAGWGRLARRGASRRTTPGGCDGAPGRAGRAGPPGLPNCQWSFSRSASREPARAKQSDLGASPACRRQRTASRREPADGPCDLRYCIQIRGARLQVRALARSAGVTGWTAAAGCSGASNVVPTRPNTDPRGRHGTDGRRRVGTRREEPRAGGTPAGRAARLADHHRPQLTAAPAWRGARPARSAVLPLLAPAAAPSLAQALRVTVAT
jgi:hypothetical protein